MIVTFLGGPEDGNKAEQPTPVGDGKLIGIPQPHGFAIYQKFGGIMRYIETVDAVEMLPGAPIATLHINPPEN